MEAGNGRRRAQQTTRESETRGSRPVLAPATQVLNISMSRDVQSCSHWLRPSNPPSSPRIWAPSLSSSYPGDIPTRLGMEISDLHFRENFFKKKTKRMKTFAEMNKCWLFCLLQIRKYLSASCETKSHFVFAKLFVFAILFAKLKISIFSREKKFFARKREEIGDFRGKGIQKVFAKTKFHQISQTWTNFMYFIYCFQSL